MANKNLFNTLRGALIPRADATNAHGAPAYKLSVRKILARMAVTGCFTSTFYASGEYQLDRVLELASQTDADFIARTALYARQRGFMKDLPALLCAILATRDLDRLAEIFPQVIDNGRMLRNFVQMLRSGATGRKSLGSAPKRLVRQWLERATLRQLLEASIGTAPSLADIVKMVHPRPADPAREAFYAWLIGKPHNAEALPEILRHYEQWKISREGELPEVPFQMLTALNLDTDNWCDIARSASWQTTRMNLNTFERHGVLQDDELATTIARRLADPEKIRRARAFPYQLLAAFLNTDAKVPKRVKNSLQDAMEHSIANVPAIAGKIVICPDVSGSMQMPVTGHRKGASTAVRCIDVAGLISAAFLRKNREAQVLPFEVRVVEIDLNGRDSVMTNATRLAKIGGGGTNCSAPLAHLNRKRAQVDLVIFVSDNESWADPQGGRGTTMMQEWEELKRRNPQARLVCIDLVPNTTTQAVDRRDILNIGGFSDAVFDVIATFAAGDSEGDAWLNEINSIPLNERMKIA